MILKVGFKDYGRQMMEANRKSWRRKHANVDLMLSFKSWLQCVREKFGCGKKGGCEGREWRLKIVRQLGTNSWMVREAPGPL